MITAVSWPCSPSSRPADIASVVVVLGAEHFLDSVGRDPCLGKKSDRGARTDQLGIVLFGMGGDQDYRRPRLTDPTVKLPHEIQAALAAEVDVDQRDVWMELLDASQRLGTARRHAYDRDPLKFQEASRSVQELRAVVDDQTAQRHGSRVPGAATQRIIASR